MISNVPFFTRIYRAHAVQLVSGIPINHVLKIAEKNTVLNHDGEGLHRTTKPAFLQEMSIKSAHENSKKLMWRKNLQKTPRLRLLTKIDMGNGIVFTLFFSFFYFVFSILRWVYSNERVIFDFNAVFPLRFFLRSKTLVSLGFFFLRNKLRKIHPLKANDWCIRFSWKRKWQKNIH